MQRLARSLVAGFWIASAGLASPVSNYAQDDAQSPAASAISDGAVLPAKEIVPLTEPPCSYVSTQHLKGLIRVDDPVIAWIRGAHNGGAAPLRHFLVGTRVINDTYGLFIYDPDGGYVSVFKKDYGYSFHGWRRGVAVIRGRDGTLWSGLTGLAFSGPQTGAKLERVPSVRTTWGHWLLLHPESTAYDLFDGKRYSPLEIPTFLSDEAQKTMGEVDARLKPMTHVLGVEVSGKTQAFVLDGLPRRHVYRGSVGDRDIAVFCFGPTTSATAFDSRIGDRKLTFRADGIAPPIAPFVDEETGSRWTLAGRAVDGPLRGSELSWVESIQARWYAWAAEHPDTAVSRPPQKPAKTE